MPHRDRAAALAAATPTPDFFDGFEERSVPLPDGGQIFCRIGGEGPPLLLLHGYPQTSAMWHAIAPDLARHYTVICADLRGYGRSHKPAGGSDHATYSKRAFWRMTAVRAWRIGWRRIMRTGCWGWRSSTLRRRGRCIATPGPRLRAATGIGSGWCSPRPFRKP